VYCLLVGDWCFGFVVVVVVDCLVCELWIVIGIIGMLDSSASWLIFGFVLLSLLVCECLFL